MLAVAADAGSTEEERVLAPSEATTWRKVIPLAVGGGLAFWAANFAISLTSVAAEYRSALSIAYLPMLLEALIGGLVIGFCVSYVLLRFFDRIPTRSPFSKAIILSVGALAVVTIFIEVPSKLGATGSDSLRYFLIATAFNVVRILALGIAVGYLYERLSRPRRRT